jgi:acyl-CoA thioesterase-1
MKILTSFKMNLARSFGCVALIGLFTSCGTPRNDQPIRESDYSAPIRVACVGDSITYGYGIKNRDQESYPAQLGALLGHKWEVRNFGVNGATALKKGTRPYTEQSAFKEALSFEPSVVVIKLGTNDTNTKSWPDHKDEFLSDYLELVRSFSEMKRRPRIYLCRPVPLFRDRSKDYDTDKILTEEVIPKINEAARKEKLPVIDLYAPFEGKANLFPDGVHPDVNGARIMAREVYARLVGHPATATENK